MRTSNTKFFNRIYHQLSMSLVGVALCCGLITNADAQTHQELDPVTITAGRWPMASTQTGQPITTISANQLAHLPFNSLEDVLKSTGLIELQQRGPLGAVNNIVIRGGTFQQVLILLDGVKLNDPVTGHFSANFPIPKWQIERIEILRGPAAAIYGSEAVGGVIHIISKSFAANKDSTLNKKYISAGLGDWNLWKAELGLHKSVGSSQIALGASTDNTKGIRLRTGNNGYVNRHSANLGWQLPLGKSGSLRAMSVFDYRDFAAENFYTTFLSDTATEKVVTWWNQVNAQWQKEKTTHNIHLAYKYTNDQYLYNPSSIANENTSQALHLLAHSQRHLNKYWRITYGTQGMISGIKSNDRGNHQTARGGLFFTGWYQHGKWNVHPGLRWEADENFGQEWLPQLSVNYHLQPFVFKLHYGKAIRAADYTERFNNYNKPIVASGSIGNPDLKAERSQSYEASVEFRRRTLTLGLTRFERRQKNVIDWVITNYDDMPRKDNLVPGNTYSLAQNIQSLKTNGWEVYFNWQQNISRDIWIYVHAMSGWTNSKANGDMPLSFYISSHAKELHQQTFSLKWKDWDVALSNIYKERAPRTASSLEISLPGHFHQMNLRLQRKIAPLQVYIDIINLLDKSSADLIGTPLPGRWVAGGISLQW